MLVIALIKALCMGYIHTHNVTELTDGYSLITVGIRCDLLGGIHMWESPLCWCSCHVSAETAP